MTEETNGDGAFTRRNYLQYGGALVTGGLFAGCTENTDTNAGSTASETEAETTTTPTTTPTSTATETPDETTATPNESYTVRMAPVGEVEFDAVPETWESYFPGYADMGVALGQASGLSAVGFKSRYHIGYYDELDGVTVDKASITQLYNDGIDNDGIGIGSRTHSGCSTTPFSV